MTIEGFDYKEFAQALEEQARDMAPDNISGINKQYLLNMLYNMTCLTGETLTNDKTYDYTAEVAMYITQIVGEWTFHKALDLIHSQVPQEHWDGILQKIAYTTYDIVKTGIIEQSKQNELLQTVEYNVNKRYIESLNDLYKDGEITRDMLEQAKSLNNIDDYAMAELKKEQQQAASQTLKVTQSSLSSNNSMLNLAIKIADFLKIFKRK